MDNVMSEVLGQKPQGPRNNTWPNRDQSDGVFGMLGEILPFDPAGMCVRNPPPYPRAFNINVMTEDFIRSVCHSLICGGK